MFYGIRNGQGGVFGAAPTNSASRLLPSGSATLGSPASGTAVPTIPGLDLDGDKAGSDGKSYTGAIIGGSVGGAVVIAVAVLIGVWMFRRHKKRQSPPPAPAHEYYPACSPAEKPYLLTSSSSQAYDVLPPQLDHRPNRIRLHFALFATSISISARTGNQTLPWQFRAR